MHSLWVIAVCVVAGLVALVLLVRELSAVWARAHYAEKEKHIKRVMDLAKTGDEDTHEQV